MIARPYAPAVSGMFASMSYDDDIRTFVLKFLSRLPGFNPRGLPRPEDTTVIFFSSLTYHRWDRLQVEADARGPCACLCYAPIAASPMGRCGKITRQLRSATGIREEATA